MKWDITRRSHETQSLYCLRNVRRRSFEGSFQTITIRITLVYLDITLAGHDCYTVHPSIKQTTFTELR